MKTPYVSRAELGEAIMKANKRKALQDITDDHHVAANKPV